MKDTAIPFTFIYSYAVPADMTAESLGGNTELLMVDMWGHFLGRVPVDTV